jgi:hypothetical protein
MSPNDFPIMTLSLFSTSLSPAQLTLIADPGVTRELALDSWRRRRRGDGRS